jgi:serine/threonine protein kinase
VSLATRTTLPNASGEGREDDAQQTDIMEVDSDDDEGGAGEQFALKRLSLPMSCLSEEERTEAITEVHVLSTLVHPNILQYEDSFLDSGALHIVMEYAAGGTLEHVIEFYKSEGVHIEEKMIWSILVQLLQALNYCHAIPIMHRDIKPANVLLSTPITMVKNKNEQLVTTVMTAITVRRAVSKMRATLREWKKSVDSLQSEAVVDDSSVGSKSVRFQTVDALTLTYNVRACMRQSHRRRRRRRLGVVQFESKPESWDGGKAGGRRASE